VFKLAAYFRHDETDVQRNGNFLSTSFNLKVFSESYMKKQIAAVMMALGVLSFSNLVQAGPGGVHGTLTKIDGEYYVVKTDDNKEVRAHFDASTKKVGAIKEGAKVEIYVDAKGHTTKIEEGKH
jgi:hypothetical protein